MKNLCNFACETKIDGKNYKLEFDNRAYATVENLLDKGTFKIFQCFVLDNNTKLQDCLEIFCAGLIKNHSSEEIEAVRKALDENPAILHKNLHALQFAYAKPLILPEVAKEVLEKNNRLKKKTKKMKAN